MHNWCNESGWWRSPLEKPDGRVAKAARVAARPKGQLNMQGKSNDCGPFNTRRLVKTAEAMAILACSRRTLERMGGDGELTRVKVRSGTRYVLAELFARIPGGGAA